MIPIQINTTHTSTIDYPSVINITNTDARSASGASANAYAAHDFNNRQYDLNSNKGTFNGIAYQDFSSQLTTSTYTSEYQSTSKQTYDEPYKQNHSHNFCCDYINKSPSVQPKYEAPKYEVPKYEPEPPKQNYSHNFCCDYINKSPFTQSKYEGSISFNDSYATDRELTF